METRYPNLYERRSFGLFLTAIERELRELFDAARDEVARLLVQ